MQYALYLILFASAVTLPWWFTVPLMVLVLSFSYGAPVVVAVALLMDALYGTNIDSLYGMSFLYTFVFGVAACVSIIMRRRMMD